MRCCAKDDPSKRLLSVRSKSGPNASLICDPTSISGSSDRMTVKPSSSPKLITESRKSCGMSIFVWQVMNCARNCRSSNKTLAIVPVTLSTGQTGHASRYTSEMCLQIIQIKTNNCNSLYPIFLAKYSYWCLRSSMLLLTRLDSSHSHPLGHSFLFFPSDTKTLFFQSESKSACNSLWAPEVRIVCTFELSVLSVFFFLLKMTRILILWSAVCVERGWRTADNYWVLTFFIFSYI